MPARIWFILVLLLVLVPVRSHAAMYDWSVTIPLAGGGDVTGTGTLSTQDTTSQSFDYAQTGFIGYLLTSISGVFQGVSVTGLLPVDYTPSGGAQSFGNDNLITPSSTGVDNDGIAFTLSTVETGFGSVVNLYFDHNVGSAGGNYLAYGVGGHLDEVAGGTFSVTPVPLPAAAWLLLSALGGLGLLRHRVQ
jgi:hypothetical protein